MKLVFFLLCCCWITAAQASTISNIAVTMDTNAATVYYADSTATDYCWVRYGISSGAYLWSSTSFPASTPLPGSNQNCAVPISGLKDGTTYYFLPTGRPDPDDETGIALGSEISGTAPSSFVSHSPAAPASVSSILLSEPDTTGYAVVNLAATGPGGECAATSSVSAPAGYSWSITTGETLTAIITANAVTFGTVFQAPAGTVCKVPGTAGTYGYGYYLPNLAVDPLASGGSIDASNHRWIILRTTPANPANLPPFGVRTSPSFAASYATFEAETPNPYAGAGNYTGGSVFEMNGGATNPVHHIWIENLELTVDASKGGTYQQLIGFAAAQSAVPPPFPIYISIRGNYFHGPARAHLSDATPAICGGVMGTSQGQISIVDNYFDNIYTWGVEDLPEVVGLLDCGSGGYCGVGGPDLIDNNGFIDTMGQSIYVEVNNHIEASPHDFTVTHNLLYWDTANMFPYAVALGSYGCRNQIEEKGMLRELIAGNWINGQWACANSGNAILLFNASDITIQSNYVMNAATPLGIDGWNSGAYLQSFNGSSNRLGIKNNLFFNLGAVWQAGGGGLQRAVIEMLSNPDNVSIRNNTVGPVSADYGSNLGEYGIPIIYTGGSGPSAGLTIENNVLPFGFGNAYGGIWTDNLEQGSHPATPAPLLWSVYALRLAQTLNSVFGYADGSAGAGMTGTSTITGGSGYTAGSSLSFTNCSASPTATIGVTGTAVQTSTFTAFGVCDPTSFTASAPGGSGTSLRPHYGLTASYTWGGNVNVCTSFLGAVMSKTDCIARSSTMPVGDTYVSAGSDIASRVASAGVSASYAITPTTANAGNAGANLNAIWRETGTVNNVGVALGSTDARVSYVAPDSRACSVDTSPDGITWTRADDTGGVPWRSLLIAGLSAGTQYQYRVLCYFEQLSPLFAGSQITDGTFTTLGGGARNPFFAFHLVAGSTSFKVTMTALDGVTQYSNTCTASPCVVSSVPVGDYSTVQRWLAGSTAIASGDAQVVRIR